MEAQKAQETIESVIASMTKGEDMQNPTIDAQRFADSITVYRSNPYIYHRPKLRDNQVEALNPEELAQATLNQGADKSMTLNAMPPQRPPQPEPEPHKSAVPAMGGPG